MRMLAAAALSKKLRLAILERKNTKDGKSKNVLQMQLPTTSLGIKGLNI